MKVLVNGIGNIGTTILNVLIQYKSDFGISEIYACKNSIHPWNLVERNILEESGIIICSTKNNSGYQDLNTVLSKVDYVFETTSNGIGLQNKNTYDKLSNIKASAQGSEKGFGIPFMTGINEERIEGEKFVNIVSCNTHGTAALLSTFAGNKLENLKMADVVVVRRSEDLGNHERLVAANVVARHLDPNIGTHHAIDVVEMFNTIDVDCNLTSSDITTPSQLMHSVRFNIELKQGPIKGVDELIESNPFIATTQKYDSNIIFELGRRYGFQGRIYSHAIVVLQNLLITEKSVKGWAFVPQEGNSILSTIHSFMLQMEIENCSSILGKINSDLLKREW